VSSPAATSVAFEPLYLALGVGLGAWYLRAARRRRLPFRRRVAFLGGLAIGAGALNSPLESIAVQHLLSAHLIHNAMIADWSPPLLVIGLTPELRAAIAARLGRPFRRLTSVPVALTVWLLAWYATHVPLLYEGALRHPRWLNLEHGILIAAGLVFWWAVLADRPPRSSHGARLALILAGFLLAGPLGFAFVLSPSPLYGYYAHRPPLWGLSPVEDQHLGGIFMNTEQAVAMFAAAAYLFKRWIDEDAVRRAAPIPR
jgi:cytochrome c oxidase assembly factor CtaG